MSPAILWLQGAWNYACLGKQTLTLIANEIANEIIPTSYMVGQEAQLWNMEAQYSPRRGSVISHRAQYSDKETQIFPNEAKATSEIMEYRQRLFIYNVRQQIIAQYHGRSLFIST